MTDQIVTYIKWSVFLLLTARGVLHFTTDIPYYLIIGSDEGIQEFLGIVFILFGFLSILPNTVLRNGRIVFYFVIPSLLMFFLSVSTFIKADYVPEQIIEHSLQIVLPVLLIYASKGHYRLASLYMMIAVFVALTFIGHALFALGFHYLPDHFVEMTSRSLLISEGQSVSFLYIVGWIDIICAIGAFLPVLRRYFVWYLIVWGVLTSLARVYYVLDEGITSQLFLVNIPNMIYRLPHGIMPFLMFVLILKLEFRSKGKPVTNLN